MALPTPSAPIPIPGRGAAARTAPIAHAVGSPASAASRDGAAAALEAACRARGLRCEVALAMYLGEADPAEGRRIAAHLREELAALTPAQVRVLADCVLRGQGGGQ